MGSIFGAIFSGIVNFFSSIITNASNSSQTSSTNNANMAMNQANIEFQKQENEITRQREDTAVQRRANDLVAAGLSKTLAAGSPAAANAMTAPSNTFAKQPFRAEAPKFDFGYDPVNAYYAPTYAQAEADKAQAEAIKAEAAKSSADTEKWRSRMEFFKFLKQYGFDVKKFLMEHGLDVEKFEHQKSMDTKEFGLKAWLGSEGVKIDKEKLQLSKDQLDLARTELDDKLKNSMSERDFRDWTKEYQAACLELDKNKDKREAEMLKYSILEIKAKVKNYLADVKLSDAQVRYYNKMGKKIITEMVVNAAQALKLDADTQNILEKTVTEIYNRGIAENDGGKTTDHTVTSSESHENALDRSNEQSLANIASMRQLFGIVLYCLLPGGFKGFYSNIGIK